MTPSDQNPPATPPESAPLDLRAGPLSLVYENGMVRDIRFGGREIVRRIYAAVRDEHWNTVAGDLSDFSMEKGQSSFSLCFSSRHRREDIDFLWNGQVQGLASGEISFSFSGIALSRFRRNRIGICVLHPADICKGMPCRIETAEGATEDAAFPYDIAPRQPFLNLRAMSYAITPGLNATIRFQGDIFETEDQRNWTDATYKTYSTPLSLPIPQVLEKGTMIRQKVSVQLDKPTAAIPFRPPALQMAFATRAAAQPVPLLGVLDAGGDLAPAAAALLKKAGLSHVRTDVRFGGGAAAEALERARLLHSRTGMAAEFALHCTDDAAAEAGMLASLLLKNPLPVSRFLVYSELAPSVPAGLARQVRDTLQAIAPVVGGTDGHFVEINRQRPPAEFLDGVCYAATPQVHAFDNTAIMENLPGLLETLAAARRFSGSKGLSISPLTLRPRKNAGRPPKDGGPDVRQATLFAAAWALGSIAYCTEGGAQSLTLCETAGPGGLMPFDGRSVFPLYVVLSWISPYIGKPAQCRIASDPRCVLGLSFDHNGSFTAIIANLTGSRRHVLLSGLPEGLACSILDESRFASLQSLPDPAAGLPEETVSVRDGRWGLELPPYGLAKLRQTRPA
jgi:hypothetical protein